VALRVNLAAVARAAFDQLLEDDDLRSESLDVLQQGQHERGLYFGAHPLCVALRPEFLTLQEYREAAQAAEVICTALGRLEEALLADETLRAELDLDPMEERLALADPGYRPSSPGTRLDSFVSSEISYVEYNAESPAGIAYGEELSRIFSTLPVMQELMMRFSLKPITARNLQLKAMMRAFRSWGGPSRAPVVAIVDWPNLPTLREFELFQDTFHEHGVRTYICEPAELEYTGGVLRGPDGVAINLVYRRVLASELLATPGASDALCSAYLDGSICVVNSFRAKLLHKKMSLALLSDEQYSRLYTPRQRAAIRRHIPWTRKVRQGPSQRDGASIPDLVEHVLRNRMELVLKPNDEYGGRGVVMGWTVDQPEWEQTVGVALTQSYVVQAAIEVPRDTYPVAVGGKVETLSLARDMDPYLFNGRVGGLLIRLSSSALLNLTAGSGSVVPAFLVEGPA